MHVNIGECLELNKNFNMSSQPNEIRAVSDLLESINKKRLILSSPPLNEEEQPLLTFEKNGAHFIQVFKSFVMYVTYPVYKLMQRHAAWKTS